MPTKHDQLPLPGPHDDEIIMGPGCSLCGHHRRLTVDPDGMVMCDDEISCMSRMLGWSVMVSEAPRIR